jgi:acetolactate synthase-1/2/3 large subunit
MGAAIGAPDRRVVAISGDGGMLYHMSEFETALRCKIPVVVLVMNNACLASEYQTQKRHQRTVNSVLDFRDVDFAAVARAFGAFGVRVTKSEDLDGAIKAALACGGPAIVDVVVSKEAQSPSANRDKTRLV